MCSISPLISRFKTENICCWCYTCIIARWKKRKAVYLTIPAMLNLNLEANSNANDTLWCSKCAKSKKHAKMGWQGWNQLDVTGIKAHRHYADNVLQCPFATSKENVQNAQKPENTDSQKAYNALAKELSSIKQALVKKGVHL